MLRKIILFSGLLLLVIGISSADFSQQPKPKAAPKKTTSKTPEAGTAKAKTEAKTSEKVITWYNMTDGYKKAKKEKKILVVDVYTDWCYWCKVMDKETYENAGVIEKMNKYFVAVKFNPEVNANHIINGDTLNSGQLGQYLAKGGRIHGYPSTFIWKNLADNSKIDTYSGYMDTASFNAVMNKTIQQ